MSNKYSWPCYCFVLRPIVLCALALTANFPLSAVAQELPTPTPTCTITPTETPTPTPTCTATPTGTATSIPTYTPTIPTPTATATAITTTTPLATATATTTPTPAATIATSSCGLTLVTSTLWPPNHKLIELTFVNSLGDVVTPNVMGVFQDEPTKVVGSGRFCPDAVIGEDGSVKVRRERTGNRKIPGDGRVYHVQFSLDTAEGICLGNLTACVPHDQGARNVCVDGGPLYDSEICQLSPKNKDDKTKQSNSKKNKPNKSSSKGKKS